jgi:transcriptional regulator with XRE-family HTH domain
MLRQHATRPLDILGHVCERECVEHGEAFGATLRRLRTREHLTLRTLASIAGSDHTHLSRLEAGRVPSRDLLERLGNAFTPETRIELFSAAERLPTEVERTIAGFPHALSPDVLAKHTKPSLRRTEAAHLASRLLRSIPAGGVDGGRVEPEILCRRLHFRSVTHTGADALSVTFDDEKSVVTIRDKGTLDDAATFPRLRFLLAHAAGHLLLEQRYCAFPAMRAGEDFVCDLAAYLLCPPLLLDKVVLTAGTELDHDASDPWTSRYGDIVSVVAEKLAIPGWVAVRRLADESLLEDNALYYSSGDEA